ncbi:MAG: hypothetical protein V9H69_25225 [Anaerolineae bacterium]
MGSTPIHSRLPATASQAISAPSPLSSPCRILQLRRLSTTQMVFSMFNQPIDFVHEDEPPRFLRAQALPYPDLQRVWTRVQLTPFAGHPELEMVILDPEAQVVAEMVMVDVQFTYISLTMHLKRPRPAEAYHLLLRLTRDHTLLDQRSVPFDLVFVERDEAMADAETLVWTERGAAMEPLPPEEAIDLGLIPAKQAAQELSNNGNSSA